MSELSEQLNQLKRNESKVTVATLVNTRGTTPRKEGAKMLVGEGGRVLGSVTIGGCVDAQVIEQSATCWPECPRLPSSTWRRGVEIGPPVGHHRGLPRTGVAGQARQTLVSPSGAGVPRPAGAP
jgi:xanthine dehydrogenase accessory factor